MSHWPESWKLPDLRSQPSDILTGCKRQPRLTMCSMARDLRRRRADPDPVVAVVAAAAVVANTTNDGKPSNSKEMEGNPHYLLTSAGDVENLDIRKVNHAKQWKQSAEVVEPKDTMRRCV